MEFPVQLLVRFWANHHLLDIFQRPLWRVVKGRSKSYVDRVLAGAWGRGLCGGCGGVGRRGLCACAHTLTHKYVHTHTHTRTHTTHKYTQTLIHNLLHTAELPDVRTSTGIASVVRAPHGKPASQPQVRSCNMGPRALPRICITSTYFQANTPTSSWGT